MEQSTSIKRNAYLRIIRLAIAFTSVIIAFFIFISLYFFKINKTIEYSNSIKSVLSNVLIYEIGSNYELALKKIQQKTGLREIAIYNKNCNLEAFSSVSIHSTYCPNNLKLEQINAQLGEERLYIYYEPQIHYRKIVQRYIAPLITITIATFILVILGLFFFLRQSFLKPLSIIQDHIIKDEELNLPTEFEFISTKLSELRKQISKNEKDKAYVQTARQVIHDIRNPLAYLKLQLDEAIMDLPTVKVKLSEIDYQISSLLSTTRRQKHKVNLKEFLLSLKIDLKYIFDINVSVPHTEKYVHLPVNVFDLNNIFSNLTKNSKEAGATAVIIDCDLSGKTLTFSFTDDGSGVSDKVRQKIFNPNFSTKTDGNGIGLSSLKKMMIDVGGDLVLDEYHRDGAKFILTLPILDFISNEVVFIDNDKYLRMGWIRAGDKKGIKVHAFESIDSFTEDIREFPKEIPIYVDSELDNNAKGEIESRRIFDMGFKNIFLATSLDEVDLKLYPWILSQTTKDVPF